MEAEYTSTGARDNPSGALAQARIERVANALTKEVVREHGQQDRQARIDREPPGQLDRVLALVEDVAPRRVRRLHAEAKEGEAGLGEDGGGDAERHGDQHR